MKNIERDQKSRDNTSFSSFWHSILLYVGENGIYH